MNPFLRTAYNYDMNEAGDESGIDCLFNRDTGEQTPSKTQQQFAEECDINTIVRRFNLTGQLPTGVRMPTYGDFENVPSYQEAMNAIRAADEAFMEMPAEVRARFNNDPARFVDFCSDPANRAEAEKLGLVDKKETIDVTPTEANTAPVEDPRSTARARSRGSKRGGEGEGEVTEGVT